MIRTAALALIALPALALTQAAPTLAQGSPDAPMSHAHGADGMGRDEVTMPALRGLDASPEESREMEIPFRHFQGITRQVENLENGIRAVTEAADPELVAALQTHAAEVSDMVARGMAAVHERMMRMGTGHQAKRLAHRAAGATAPEPHLKLRLSLIWSQAQTTC